MKFIGKELEIWISRSRTQKVLPSRKKITSQPIVWLEIGTSAALGWNDTMLQSTTCFCRFRYICPRIVSISADKAAGGGGGKRGATGRNQGPFSVRAASAAVLGALGSCFPLVVFVFRLCSKLICLNSSPGTDSWSSLWQILFNFYVNLPWRWWTLLIVSGPGARWTAGACCRRKFHRRCRWR